MDSNYNDPESVANNEATGYTMGGRKDSIQYDDLIEDADDMEEIDAQQVDEKNFFRKMRTLMKQDLQGDANDYNADCADNFQTDRVRAQLTHLVKKYYEMWYSYQLCFSFLNIMSLILCYLRWAQNFAKEEVVNSINHSQTVDALLAMLACMGMYSIMQIRHFQRIWEYTSNPKNFYNILLYNQGDTRFQNFKEKKYLDEKPNLILNESRDNWRFCKDPKEFLVLFAYFFFLMLMQPYAFLKDIVIYRQWITNPNTGKYEHLNFELDQLLMMFMFIRIYWFERAWLFSQGFSSLHTRQVCRKNGFQMKMDFLLKIELSKGSGLQLLTLTIKVIIYLSLLLYIAELSYYVKVYPIEEDRPYVLPKCLWMVIITGSTVGYGGIIPHTLMGQFLIVITIFAGAFATGLLIAALTTAVDFTPPQKLAYDEIIEKEAASKAIISGLKYNMYRNQRYQSLKDDNQADNIKRRESVFTDPSNKTTQQAKPTTQDFYTEKTTRKLSDVLKARDQLYAKAQKFKEKTEEEDNQVLQTVEALAERQVNLEKRFESVESSIKDLKDCFAMFMYMQQKQDNSSSGDDQNNMLPSSMISDQDQKNEAVAYMTGVENAMKSVQEMRQNNEEKNQDQSESNSLAESHKSDSKNKAQSLSKQLTIGFRQLENESNAKYDEVSDQESRESI